MTYQCNVCGSDNLQDLFSLNKIPVYCNILFSSKEKSQAIPQGDLKLMHCMRCDHIFNIAFDPSLIDYDVSYDASLDYSPRFQQYAESLAEKLIDFHQLKNKTVIEIACGKGGFLNRLAELADNQYIGYDPSFDDKTQLNSKVSIIPEYFGSTQDKTGSDNPAFERADLIICRHALEHIDQPSSLIKTLTGFHQKEQALETYFEVPNSLFLVRDLSIWDFIYEHVSYFSSKSLSYIFESSGFVIEQCYETYEGQFLALHASIGSNKQSNPPTTQQGPASHYINSLKDHLKSLLEKWNSFLANDKQKTVLWGAGSKGVTFLNIIDNSHNVAAIVDLNPNKLGKYTPGTGHQIISPEQLTDINPDNIIVMNPIYKDEIADKLHSMGIKPAIHSV